MNHSATVHLDAKRIFEQEYQRICARTDRMFAHLLIAQWIVGIAIAVWLSPRTWEGSATSTHVHVYAAVVLGGIITVVPVVLSRVARGRQVTRYAVAIAQLSWSGLFIHLTGGRLETHFHIFGSLACVAFYRDFRVLLPASVVVAVDHFVRGVVWPESIYGTTNPEWWRFLEHGAWVVFLDAFLIANCVHARRDLRELALRQASMEESSEGLRRAAETLEEKVEARTSELAKRNDELGDALSQLASSEEFSRAVLDTADDGILAFAGDEVFSANPAVLTMFARTCAPSSVGDLVFLGRDDQELHIADPALWNGETAHRDRHDLRALNASGEVVHLSTCLRTMEVAGKAHQVAFMRDITEIKMARAQAERLNVKLIRQSRLAGMAEVATGVLHNVGNVLNSVNVASTSAHEAIRSMGGSRLRRMLERSASRPGGTQEWLRTDGVVVARFLDKLADQLDAQQGTALSQLGELRNHIDHVKHVISKQQSLAKQGGVNEEVTPAGLVDDAIALVKTSLERHQVQLVIRHAEPDSVHEIDRHRVLQILVNLVGNARDALRGVEGRTREVEVSSFMDGEELHFSVRDNGVGMGKEAQSRLFTHGYTTKKDGHGFGLHNCALSAADMGGRLTADSDGVGCGATFTLTLPKHSKREAA